MTEADGECIKEPDAAIIIEFPLGELAPDMAFEGTACYIFDYDSFEEPPLGIILVAEAYSLEATFVAAEVTIAFTIW